MRQQGSTSMTPEEQRRRNARLGLILALLALALFVGFIAQRYLLTRMA